MEPIDFSPLVWLAVVGLAAVILSIIALPFVAWWLWNHVSLVVK